jgi:hypothetical protein
MHQTKHSLLRWVPAIVAASCIAQGLAEAATVRTVPPTVQRKTFDPANPPAAMPHLTPPEAAVTVCEFGFSAEPLYDVTSRDRIADGTWSVTISVKSVAVRVRLGIVIWLPKDASDKLKAHEEGHRKLDEANYKRLAEDAAKLAAGEMEGAQFTGQGKTAWKAESDAIRSLFEKAGHTYLAHSEAENRRINEIYDQITAHGTNDVPESEAARQATEQYEREKAKPE